MLLILYVTGCLGWSVGYHGLLVHRSFKCSRWLRNVLCYLGTLTGVGGPIGHHLAHNTRDYYQNLPENGNILGYRSGFFRSYYLLLFDRPFPADADPAEIHEDPYLRFLERTGVCHQVFLAIVLYLLGGWSYVVWGSVVRLTVAVDLLALANYFSHTAGYRSYRLDGVTDEGRNNFFIGFFVNGEGWHNNYHAYPGSAGFGIAPWQFDPGYLCILALKAVGLVWDVKTPAELPLRANAQPVARKA